jgi:hypothetical protein
MEKDIILYLFIFIFVLYVLINLDKNCNEKFLVPSNELPNDLMYIHN